VTLLNTPLTSANALDPFNPAATNRTSPAVLAGLLATTGQFQQNRQELLQYNIKLDGTLLTLPAGDVKVAIGGEYVSTPSHATGVNNLNLGPTVASSVLNVNYPRNVRSAYGEILLPVISEDMNIPLVRRLDLNVSGRYDDYSDFGSTWNPKFAANWAVVSGLKLRGNIASSFVAPTLNTLGQNGVGAFKPGHSRISNRAAGGRNRLVPTFSDYAPSSDQPYTRSVMEPLMEGIRLQLSKIVNFFHNRYFKYFRLGFGPRGAMWPDIEKISARASRSGSICTSRDF